MNAQEIFDKVARHLLTQNRKAQNESKSCMYRAPDGSKCAVGCLITDEAYNTVIEGETVEHNIVRDAVAESIGPFGDREEELLAALQRVHDSTAVESWPHNLIRMAELFGLSFAVVAELRPEAVA